MRFKNLLKIERQSQIWLSLVPQDQYSAEWVDSSQVQSTGWAFASNLCLLAHLTATSAQKPVNKWSSFYP